MQEEIQRQTNRSVRWKKITSNANYNTVGWIHRQLVVIENWHLHIDKSHSSWQFETCFSKLLNCEHAGQQTVETARWPWYVNSSPHLLSHKESKPTYSMFKQQRFLQEIGENNGQCQDQSGYWLQWGGQDVVWSHVEGPTFDWVNSRKLAARPSSSVSLSVLMATFRMWMGSSSTLWKTAWALVTPPVDHVSQESLCLRDASTVVNWSNDMQTSRAAQHRDILHSMCSVWSLISAVKDIPTTSQRIIWWSDKIIIL